MNKNELDNFLKRITTDKHDIVEPLKGVVLLPISDMLDPGVSTQLFDKIQGQSVYDKSTRIMTFFEGSWEKPEMSEQDQLTFLIKKCNSINTDVVPLILDVVTYYKDCLKHPEFFSNSKDGNDTRKLMENSVNDSERVISELRQMANRETSKVDTTLKTSANLLEIIQNDLDSVQAEVLYEDEFDKSQISVYLNAAEFSDHVLKNIRNNINNHAFLTKEYQHKHLWEKQVKVSIDEDNKYYIVTIVNNGTKFKGNKDNLFEHGYCHGEMKHSGKGLYSARKYMRELGGDLEIKIDNSTLFSFSYLIKIKK